MQTNLTTDELESKQPTLIGKYLLSGRMCNDNSINMASTNVGFNYKQYPTNKFNIETESKLRGMDNKLNKYPTYIENDSLPLDTREPSRDITNDFITNIGEPTRVLKSCNDSSIDMIKRFDYLPDTNKSPQNNAIFDEKMRGGYNSRIV